MFFGNIMRKEALEKIVIIWKKKEEAELDGEKYVSWSNMMTWRNTINRINPDCRWMRSVKSHGPYTIHQGTGWWCVCSSLVLSLSCRHTLIQTCARTYTQACAHTYTQTCADVYKHTFTHPCIHTHKHKLSLRNKTA